MSIVNRGSEKSKGNNTKYIHFFLIAAAFAVFKYFSATPSAGDTKVYQFGGWHHFVSLHGGLIVVTDTEHRFYPGILSFREAVTLNSVQISFFVDDEYGTHLVFLLSSGYRDTETQHHVLTPLTYYIEDLSEHLESIVNSGTFHCEIILFFADGETSEFSFEFFVTDIFEEYSRSPMLSY